MFILIVIYGIFFFMNYEILGSNCRNKFNLFGKIFLILFQKINYFKILQELIIIDFKKEFIRSV